MIPNAATKRLRAFHGDAKLKKSITGEILAHQKQDQIVQGTYGETSGGKWRGCAVGCSIHSLNVKCGKDIRDGGTN